MTRSRSDDIITLENVSGTDSFLFSFPMLSHYPGSPIRNMTPIYLYYVSSMEAWTLRLVTSLVTGRSSQSAVTGQQFVAPFLFVLFPCDFIEFTWTGTVFYGVRKVVIKLEPSVQNQLSECGFVTFRSHPGRPRAAFSLVPLCAAAAVLL